jgi:hypothetical protein
MDEVKVMQVIYCTKERRGRGTSDLSPVRIITEIYSVDGQFIAEADPCGGYTIEDMTDFAIKFKEGKWPGPVGDAFNEWKKSKPSLR